MIIENYNAEFESTTLRKVKVENITNTYSAANALESDLTNKGQNHQIYKKFVAHNFNDYSISQLTGYFRNNILRELSTEEECFSTANVRVEINLRDSKGYTGELEKLKGNDSKCLAFTNRNCIV